MRSRTGGLEACAGAFGHEVPVSISSSPGPCAGHIIGLRRSVREWALRQGLEQAAGAPVAGAGNLGGRAGDAGGALRLRAGSLRPIARLPGRAPGSAWRHRKGRAHGELEVLCLAIMGSCRRAERTRRFARHLGCGMVSSSGRRTIFILDDQGSVLKGRWISDISGNVIFVKQ
jgi:hypothetical protein